MRDFEADNAPETDTVALDVDAIDEDSVTVKLPLRERLALDDSVPDTDTVAVVLDAADALVVGVAKQFGMDGEPAAAKATTLDKAIPPVPATLLTKEIVVDEEEALKKTLRSSYSIFVEVRAEL